MMVASIYFEHFNVHQVRLIWRDIDVFEYIIENLVCEVNAVLFNQENAFIEI